MPSFLVIQFLIGAFLFHLLLIFFHFFNFNSFSFSFSSSFILLFNFVPKTVSYAENIISIILENKSIRFRRSSSSTEFLIFSSESRAFNNFEMHLANWIGDFANSEHCLNKMRSVNETKRRQCSDFA